MNKYKLLGALAIGFHGSLIAGDFVFVQKDSPLQVVGVTSTLKDLYSRVFVVNVSTKPIQRAQFGWTVSYRVDNTKQVVGLGYGPPVDLNLPPFEVSEAGAQGATVSLTMDKMKELGTKQIGLTLGVVYVKFQDGNEWRYPLEGGKQFIEINDPALVEKIGPKFQEFREKIGLRASSQSCSSPRASTTQSKGVLAWIGNLLMPTAYAQGDLVFVCDPSPRVCVNDQTQCTTYFCFPPYYCNYFRCCLLNIQTGQKICD